MYSVFVSVGAHVSVCVSALRMVLHEILGHTNSFITVIVIFISVTDRSPANHHWRTIISRKKLSEGLLYQGDK